MTAALALRIRAAGGARGVVLLDILIAIGALGSISAAFVVDAILAGGSSSLLALVTALAYPVADLVLATLVLHLAAASGWRLGRATALMAVCFLCWAVDGHDLRLPDRRTGPMLGGGLLDLGWVAPFALFGVAAWMRPDPPSRPAEPRPARAGGARGLRGRRPRDGRLLGDRGRHHRLARVLARRRSCA